MPTPPSGLLELPVSDAGFYAIVGATVHPVASEPIRNGVVVMQNGIITAVGERFTPPGGATVVDGRGFHVYPGLVNAASQVGLVEMNAIDVTDDTTEIARFQPDVRAVSGVNPQSAHVGVTLCEGITTTAVLPRGGYVSGRGGVIQLDGWTLPEMLRHDNIGLVVELPSLRPNLDEEDRKKRLEEHRKTLETIERYFERAIHYAKVSDLDELDEIESRNVQLEAMIPYVRGDKQVYFRAATYKEITEAVRFAETFELRPVIVGGDDAWKCADMLAAKGVPVIVTGTYAIPSGRYEAYGATYAIPSAHYEAYDAKYANAGKLEAAGVTFCIATDGSAYAKRLPLHAGLAVAHGLSEERALRAITLDAAALLGIADDVGSLETGKTADVIITTGNPCQANTRTVAAFVAGEPRGTHKPPRTALHEMDQPSRPRTCRRRGAARTRIHERREVA